MSIAVNIKKNLGSFRLDVAFSQESGVLALLGGSGCGKSMTLRCIAGIETPDSGKIVLNGVTVYDSERKINLPPQQRQVGLLFQNYALFPNMTVEENILCGLREKRDKSEKRRCWPNIFANSIWRGWKSTPPPSSPAVRSSAVPWPGCSLAAQAF